MPGERGNLSGGQSPAAWTASQQKSQGRRYGFACSNCRRRKAKCDGAVPVCQKCVLAHEICTYEKRPSVAFTVTLQHELKAYRDLFEQLRKATDVERDALLAKPIATEKPRGGKARASSPSDFGAVASSPSDFGAVAPCPDVERNSLQKETSIGVDGQVYFYGTTSLYHIELQETDKEESSNGNNAIPRHDARFEEQNQMASFLAEISSALLDELLDTYWCWPHHLHCVLVKKVFLRDLRTLGPYVSPFLVSAVLTQAARYSTRADAAQIGDRFARRALELLVGDIDRGSSIATIQGLLIFSARECACGRTSQGWLYSGMAFRMGRDLGLHVPPKKLGSLSSHFSDEDLALRQQIFWSCYLWDKTMSVCLGRAPVICETIELPTADTLLDGHDADNEIWYPVSVQGSLSESLFQQRALSSTRFVAYCELCTIIYDVLDKLYSRPYPAQREHMLAYLTQTLDKLDAWSSRLSRDLLVSEATKLCPPLHILLLNLLQHTTAILLCRPYRTVSSAARERCTTAARMTDALFTLHVRRFGFRCITWLQTYTMFVACTINVCDFKESREGPAADTTLAQEASARLEFGLEVLKQAESTPSAWRCAAIMKQLLQSDSNEPPKEPAQRDEEIPATTTDKAGSWRTPTTSTHDQFSKVAAGAGGYLSTDPQLTRHGSSQNLACRRAEYLVQRPVFQPHSDDLSLENAQSLSETRNLAALDLGLHSSGIETPFRWLPENVCDDGSWMLMDMELGPGLVYSNET